MPIQRPTPYSAFNFLVALGDGTEAEVIGGFAEVSGLNAEVTIAEYRNGNVPVNYVTKIPGIHKAGDVTLKRGVIGAQNIYDWLEQIRGGAVDAKRSVEVRLQDESQSQTVVTWRLLGAMPMKYTAPNLTAKGGTDVAMEELVLAVETIEQL